MFNSLMPSHTDPAEQGYLRFFYRDWRPTRFGRFWSRAFAWVAGLGLAPRILLTLQVKDRSTDCFHEIILLVARYQGQCCLARCSEMVLSGCRTYERLVERHISSAVGLIQLCLRRSRLRSAHRSSKPGARLRRVVAGISRSHTRRRSLTSKPFHTITLRSASTMRRM